LDVNFGGGKKMDCGKLKKDATPPKCVFSF